MFDYATHEYTKDGFKYPSVTQILQIAGVIHGMDFIDAIHRENGEAVHELIAMHQKGLIKDVNDFFNEAIENAYQSYKLYLYERQPKIVQVEKILFSEKYKFAGTIDAITQDNIIIDWKTGQAQYYHGLQTAGYRLLCKDNGLNVTDIRLIYISKKQIKYREVADRNDRMRRRRRLMDDYWVKMFLSILDSIQEDLHERGYITRKYAGELNRETDLFSD